MDTNFLGGQRKTVQGKALVRSSFSLPKEGFDLIGHNPSLCGVGK